MVQGESIKMNNNLILYIGGFELPDKNAAAQRVIGIAKGLSIIGYETIFLNSLTDYDRREEERKNYYGFNCINYKQEAQFDHLISAKTVVNYIKTIKPAIVFAYNYPACSLRRIYKFCKKNGIKCFADLTEWYKVDEGDLIYRIIKTLDTEFRMRYVVKRMDGVLTVSRFLFDYYKEKCKAVMIPPTVDIEDEKWRIKEKHNNGLSFVYAGSPSLQKERLDYIVKAIDELETKRDVHLNIVGITESQFRLLYSWEGKLSDKIIFKGRLDHLNALQIIKESDWSIIIRDNNFVVNAGFPTKIVESISCGTPVIVNEFSNILDYLDDSNSIIIENVDMLKKGISMSSDVKTGVERGLFDYHNYVKELKDLLCD